MKNPKLLCPETPPEWLLNMPAKGGISSKEVAALFGFSSLNVVHWMAIKGGFPKPDFELQSIAGGKWRRKIQEIHNASNNRGK